MFLAEIIYFMLPAYFANMAPVIFGKINFLNFPIDFGKKLLGQSLLGKTKTYRGFFFGAISSLAIIYLQTKFYDFPYFKSLSLINYKKENLLILSLLFGLGALTGDLIKSFIKRRLNKKPSQPWIVFDQIDFVIGSLVFISPIISFSLYGNALILIVSFLLTVITNHLSWSLGFRKEKW